MPSAVGVARSLTSGVAPGRARVSLAEPGDSGASSAEPPGNLRPMARMRSRTEVIGDAVRAGIVSGKLKPGERILEEAIAEEHHVSRVPVREALRRLEAEGFVTLTPYRGATVAAPSAREGLELLTVRRGLEVLAARLAAERRGSGHEQELLAAVAAEEAAGERHDLEGMLAQSLRFHELVLLAAGNSQLTEIMGRLVERIAWVFEIDLEERAASAAADHAAIVRAILAGSPVQAGFLMDEHVAQDEALYRARSPLGF